MKNRLKKIKNSNDVLNLNNPAWKEEIDWLIEQTEKVSKIDVLIEDNVKLDAEDILDEIEKLIRS